jgi:peptide/nickel transport system permease protein
MRKQLLNRVLAVIPIMLGISMVTFLLLSFSTVNPAEQKLGPGATAAQIQAEQAALGIDESVPTQYWHWLVGAVGGNLGHSYYTGVSVTESIAQRLPVTLSLLIGGLIVAVVIGVPFGVLAAVHRGRAVDRTVAGSAALALAVPGFWLGMLLVIVFAVRLGWFPAVGYTAPSVSVLGWLRSMVLPSVALGLAGSAAFARQARSAMISVIEQDYIRAAIARGLPRRRVLFRGALVNAAIPLVTLGALQASTLFGASIIIERVFTLPGLGTMAIDAAVRDDVPNMLGFVLVAALIVIVVNLLMDVAYATLNPKVRLGS